LDASFDPDLAAKRSDGARIEALGLLSDGRVVVGGQFEQPGGGTSPHFAVLSNLGSVPPTDAATPTLAGPVHTLRVQEDGAVLVGGSFWSAFGEMRFGLARITAGKAAWERGVAVTASGGELRVHWDGPGRLLEAAEITGPWRPVPQDESPYAPPTEHGAGFYRWVD
jgi:hypothetical protein